MAYISKPAAHIAGKPNISLYGRTWITGSSPGPTKVLSSQIQFLSTTVSVWHFMSSVPEFWLTSLLTTQSLSEILCLSDSPPVSIVYRIKSFRNTLLSTLSVDRHARWVEVSAENTFTFFEIIRGQIVILLGVQNCKKRSNFHVQ